MQLDILVSHAEPWMLIWENMPFKTLYTDKNPLINRSSNHNSKQHQSCNL